jgi:predicted nucleic acid-binding protein
MIVLDASAVLEILSLSEKGVELSLSLADTQIHAPELIDVEVLNVLRKWTFAGIMSATHSEQAVKTFRSLDITRHRHSELVPAIWALRHNLSAYDASYLALAHALGAELVTMDSGLRKMAWRGRPN